MENENEVFVSEERDEKDGSVLGTIIGFGLGLGTMYGIGRFRTWRKNRKAKKEAEEVVNEKPVKPVKKTPEKKEV